MATPGLVIYNIKLNNYIFRTLALKRFDIKKEYEEARKIPGIDKEQLVGEYMKIMGGNIIESTLIDRLQSSVNG